MKDRQKKTPEERALEALGTAERVRTKALNKLSEARGIVLELEEAVEKATARLEYVAIHPDLPQEERDRLAAYLHPEPQDVTDEA